MGYQDKNKADYEVAGFRIQVRPTGIKNDEGQELYSRGLILTEEARIAEGLEPGRYEELYTIDQVPVFKGEIIQKGKRKFVSLI